MKNKIPILLIYTRLVFAWIILALGIAKLECSSMLIAVLLVVGILTDVFDGIIARQLKISTSNLRQLDTKIDRIFWLSALFALAILHPTFFIQHLIGIIILGALELMGWAIGKLKFKSNISFHSILSKFWAISILITFLDALTDGKANLSFSITFWYGLIAQVDIVLIAFILPELQCDIPSSWHAFQIRRGKAIKRMKLFNG